MKKNAFICAYIASECSRVVFTQPHMCSAWVEIWSSKSLSIEYQSNQLHGPSFILTFLEGE